MTLELLHSTPPEPSTPAPIPLGSITPRLWTPPLRPLTPATSYGYRVIWFAAEILREPLRPWQQWAVIHAGELLPNGWPRFRQLVLIVARQQGKTHLAKVLALYWLFVERQALVFGTSTQLEQAKEAWQAAVDTAHTVPALAARSLKARVANGQEVFPTVDRCSYRIGAANRKGGRGKTIRRSIGDELREQHTWDAYNAVTYATNAVDDAQIIYITNMGDAKSVVLNSLRADALAGADTRLGVLEWSAAPGTHPNDPAGWAAANPELGRSMDPSVIAGAAARVCRPGADPEARNGFVTEVLCMSVAVLDPAVDPEAWARGREPGTLDDVRDRVALLADVSLDGMHATLTAAARLEDDRVRVEPVQAWEGPHAARELAAALPGIAKRVRPRRFGWFPGGPAASLVGDLKPRPGVWPPRGCEVEALRGDAPGVCMGFAQMVDAGEVVHAGDPLQDAHVLGAEKLWTGDRWTFTRRGAGHADAAYAAAGAVHLARSIPRPRRVSRRALGAPEG